MFNIILLENEVQLNSPNQPAVIQKKISEHPQIK